MITAAAGGSGCSSGGEDADAGRALLTARPLATGTSAPPGTRSLGDGGTRDGVLHVPDDFSGAMPLLVLLHGAGGSGAGILQRLVSAAGSLRAAVVAPDSAGGTWDALNAGAQTMFDALTQRRVAGFGPDVGALDRALRRVFESIAVDPERIAIGGFSDGASYALSLGLINGDLFRRIVAFSPGFIVDGRRVGAPEIFVSHGRSDTILPIDRCSRRIVPALRASGYAVSYQEFEGGHDIPGAVAREAVSWLLG